MLSLAIRKPIWDLIPCIPYWPLKYVNKFFKISKIRYSFGSFHSENAAYITKQEQSLFAGNKRSIIILEERKSILDYCQKHTQKNKTPYLQTKEKITYIIIKAKR